LGVKSVLNKLFTKGNLERYTRHFSKQQEESFSTKDYLNELKKDSREWSRKIIAGETDRNGEPNQTANNIVLETQGFGLAALEDGNIELAAETLGSVSKLSSMQGFILEKYNKMLSNLSQEQRNNFLKAVEIESSKQRDVKKDYDNNAKKSFVNKY
jgi:hypothetical protein